MVFGTPARLFRYLVLGTQYLKFSKPEHLFRLSDHLFVFGEQCSAPRLVDKEELYVPWKNHKAGLLSIGRFGFGRGSVLRYSQH